MTHSNKITVTVSLKTYRKIQQRRVSEQSYRQRTTRCARKQHLRREERKKMLHDMRQGYIQMGELNLALANDEFTGEKEFSG